MAGNGSRLPGLIPTGRGRLAGHGMLWPGLAAGLWLTGDRWARRAAWRGMGGVAAAGAAAAIVGKGLRASKITLVPSARAASTAAFATGVALEKPGLAVPAIVLAAAGEASQAAPVAPAGKGLALVANTSAGTASPGLASRLRPELPQATIMEVNAGRDLAGQLRLASRCCQCSRARAWRSTSSSCLSRPTSVPQKSPLTVPQATAW
jgi:hypothetical protein